MRYFLYRTRTHRFLYAAREKGTCPKRVFVISDSTYRELILRRSDRNDTDTNVEPGGRAVPITSAPFPSRLSEGKKKKEGNVKKEREGKKLKSIPRRCIGTIMRPPSFEDSRPRRVGTRELNSWQQQESCPSPDNWSPVQREDRLFVSPAVSPTMHLDSDSSADSLRRLIFSSSSSTFFSSCTAASILFHLYSPQRVRFEGRGGGRGESFSLLRNATLRPPLFSRRVSPIFRFLFRVPRTTGARRAAPLS